MFSWQLIGHQKITNYLELAITNHRLAHAYLFYGPKQIGKKTLVKKFIQNILCHQAHPEKENWPCYTCSHCEHLQKNIHPDVIWLKKETDKKEISIEQIRALQEHLLAHAFFKSYRLAIIEQAELLSPAAANALLKTLEEPAKNVVLILVANQINLPLTILSRVQKIKMNPVSYHDIYEHLVVNKVDRERARDLAHVAEGRPGRALYFERVPELWSNYQSQVRLFLSLFYLTRRAKLSLAEKLLSHAETLTEKNTLLSPLLNLWEIINRDLILSKLELSDKLININSAAAINDLAQKFPLTRFLAWHQKIKNTKKYLALNANPKLALENMLLSL
ncbi:MAG TPA: hypothetical protein PKZ16_02130 [bacterium]|nr:hypothetical protein [bacterium]HPL95631.1 hypothetical protein [bacterium]